jgi:ubiquitin-protein ligase
MESNSDCDYDTLSYDSNEEYVYEDEELGYNDYDAAQLPDPSFGLLQKQESYVIYGKDEEVEQSRSEILDEESDLLGITKYEVNLLMQHFNWDIQKMRDNYFADENKVRQLCGIAITSNPDKDNILHSIIEKCNLCQRSCHPFFSSPHSPMSDAESALKLTRSLSASDRDAKEDKIEVLINNMNTFAIKTVNRQLKELTKKNVYEFSLPDEDSFQRIHVNINAKGMWDGLSTEFQILISSNYPLSPPTVKCLKIYETFHPNVDPKDGSVCMHLITSDQWREVNTLTDVCIAIEDIFINPNFDHSLNHEALELFEKDIDIFKNKITSSMSSSSPPILNEFKRSISSSGSNMHLNLPTEEDYVSETFALECGHYFCDDCWHRSLKNSIDNGVGCQFKNCLEKDCNLIIPERLIRQIIPEKLDIYFKFQTISYIASKQSTKNCPNPNCNAVIDYPKNNTIRDINCPCGTPWCWGNYYYLCVYYYYTII